MITATMLAVRRPAWRPPAGTLGIVALGQAGFAIVRGADRVLIDPYLSPRAERLAAPVLAPQDLHGVTAVLATHEHIDHLDLPSWVGIARASPDARFVVPEPLVPLVTDAGIPGRRVIGAGLAVPVALGEAVATAVPARHAVRVEDGYSLGEPGLPPRFVGYAIQLGGVLVYHSGDTLADDTIVDAVTGHRPAIAILPINGRNAERERRGVVGNLSPVEAAGLARDLAVALAIPMHFDGVRGNTGSPGAFVRAMHRHHPTSSVWVPSPGAGILWPAESRPRTGTRS